MTVSPPETSSMRRVVVSADGIRIVDAPVPTLREGEVLVRSTVAGICGSDTHAAHGRHPFISLPYHPGHEVVGVVQAVSPGVEGFGAGQRVTVEPDLPCWHCKMCTSGRQNLCENLTFFGCGYEQGGMADYFTVDARRLHLVPDELDDRTAALIEPLSTPVHAVRIGGDVRGKAVVILGAGTIGLLLLSVVVAHGARRIVVTDVLPDKRERALALGAHVVIDAIAPDVDVQVKDALGESADVVYDCVAINSTVRLGVGLASKGGTVVVVGVPVGEVSVPLPMLQDHQIRLQGSATYLPEDYAESIELLRSGAVRANGIITAVHPMEYVASAFDESAAGHQVKVLVQIS